jgi:hypothetical protein
MILGFSPAARSVRGNGPGNSQPDRQSEVQNCSMCKPVERSELVSDHMHI